MLNPFRLAAPPDYQEPIYGLASFMEAFPQSQNDCIISEKSGVPNPQIENKYGKKLTVPKSPRCKRTSLGNRLQEEQRTNIEFITCNMETPSEIIGSHQSNIPFSSQIQTAQEIEQLRDKSHFEQTAILKSIIKKHKINAIVRNFVKKIKRVSVLKEPIQYQVFQKNEQNIFWHKQGIQIPLIAENIFNLFSITVVLAATFIFSIGLVHRQLQNQGFMPIFNSFTFLFSVLEIIVNLTIVKRQSGKKIQTLMQLWQNYLSGSLIVDLSVFLVLLLSLFIDSTIIVNFRILIILKIPHCLDKMEQLEVYFIKNLYNEQYWSLIKILLFNFSFAHIISILLTGMSHFSPGNNWMTSKGIEHSPWIEKYSWSYYWANTIMLTVGFGDLVANSYKEAICLVFIETFSCMAFAYNINCIGTIIQQIRAKDAERSQKSKIFTKLNDKNNLSEQLTWKINNYIEETARLRKLFDYEQQREFIANLPVQMKKQYLKQSNKKIFENINFFSNFISKTLYNLAEKIQMRVSHPEETIQHLYDDYNLLILKSGSVGFVCKRPNYQSHPFVMDVLKAREDKPELLNLDFISRKRSPYEIKSTEYSVFYFLSYQKFMEVLRETEMDYEFFCTLRDKMKSIPDQFEVFQCQLCQGKHLKSICPKLHYIPYKQNTIMKYLHNQKKSFNNRFPFQRPLKQQNYQNAFFVFRKSLQNVDKISSMVQSKRRKRSLSEQQQISISQNDSRQKKHWSSVEKSMMLFQEEIKTTTVEMLKGQIAKMLNSEAFSDQIWQLKSDILQNYNAYFNEYNPAQISTRYSKLLELINSQTILKAHTSVMIQLIRNHPNRNHKPIVCHR